MTSGSRHGDGDWTGLDVLDQADSNAVLQKLETTETGSWTKLRRRLKGDCVWLLAERFN